MPAVLKSGSLNLLEPSGPVQAWKWTALPLLWECTKSYVRNVYNTKVTLYKFWAENLNAQDHVRKVRVSRMIILKWIVKKIKCDEAELI